MQRGTAAAYHAGAADLLRTAFRIRPTSFASIHSTCQELSVGVTVKSTIARPLSPSFPGGKVHYCCTSADENECTLARELASRIVRNIEWACSYWRMHPPVAFGRACLAKESIIPTICFTALI